MQDLELTDLVKVSHHNKGETNKHKQKVRQYGMVLYVANNEVRNVLN